MTAPVNDQTGRRKRPEPSAEAKAAAELVRAAKEQGLSLTGRDMLLVSVELPHLAVGGHFVQVDA